MKEPKMEEENVFQYKGFDISIVYDNSGGLYYGKIVNSNSSIGFILRDSKKPALIEKIHEAIDSTDFQMKTVEKGECFYKGSGDDIMYSITIGEE